MLYLLYSGKIWRVLNLANWLSVGIGEFFNLAIRILSAIDMHAIIHIGEFLIWQSLPNLPNHQIKNLAKVSRYTVYEVIICKHPHLLF